MLLIRNQKKKHKGQFCFRVVYIAELGIKDIQTNILNFDNLMVQNKNRYK
jgi:hypothetical protein